MRLTDNASQALTSLITREGLPDTAGARIAVAPPGPDGDAALALTLVREPEPDDAVEQHGQARVFLEPGVVDALNGHVLDAVVDGPEADAQDPGPAIRFSVRRDDSG